MLNPTYAAKPDLCHYINCAIRRFQKREVQTIVFVSVIENIHIDVKCPIKRFLRNVLWLFLFAFILEKERIIAHY